MPNLTNNCLDILLGLSAAVIGILAFANEFPDRKYIRKIKSLPFKLIVFALATCLGVWATIHKNWLAENQKFKEESESKKEQHKNDLANRQLTDLSNAKIVKTFTESLARYNLKYDSSQNAILKFVRDSAKKEVKNLYGNHPEIDFCNIELKTNNADTLMFNITVCCDQSAAHQISFETLIVQNEYGKPYGLVPDNSQYYTRELFLLPSKNSSFGKFITHPNKGVKNYYFVFIGKYFDSDGKEYPIRLIKTFDISTKTFGAPLDPIFTSIANYIRQLGFRY